MALTKIPGSLIETGAVTGNVIADGGIITAKLADGAITTVKVTDGNITHAKLHTTMDLTGKTVTVATAAGSTNTTAAASTAFVQQEITTLIGGAPGTLDTLNELAAAINDDSNYNSTLTTALATKLPLAGGTMTGQINANSNPIINVSTLGLNGDITMTEDDKIKTVESSGGSFLQLRSDSLGVTSNSTALIGLNDIIIGAKSNNAGTGNIYFGVGSENRTSGWTDTLTIAESGTIGINKTSGFESGGFASPAIVIKQRANNNWAGINIEANGNDSVFAIGNEDDRHVIAGSYRATAGYKDLEFVIGGRANVIRLDTDGNVCIDTENDGAPGLTINESKNLSFGTGNDNESYVNFFRESSSAAAVMATGYRRSAIANRMESSIATSWAKSAVTANYGTIRFYTDSAAVNAVGTTLQPTERMRIDNAGNVGVGVTSIPSWANLMTSGTVAVGGVLYIKQDQKIQGLTAFPGGAGNISLNPDGGNVGIGTTGPQTPLHVARATASLARFERSGSAIYQLTVTDGGAGAAQLYFQALTNDTGFNFQTKNSSGSAVDTLFMAPSGNVGISDTNPESRLEVNEGTNYRGVHVRGSNSPCFTLAQGTTSTPSWRLGISGYDGNDFAISTGSTVGDQVRMDPNGNIVFGLATGNVTPPTGLSPAPSLVARGPISSGYTQGSYNKHSHNIRDWFVYAGPTTNTNSYVHMKTNLWGGGSPSGNTEYTMSVFRYHSYYAYGGSATPGGTLGWHNWSGSFYNIQLVNEGSLLLVQNSYLSSDGYVVLVALLGAAYAQFSIDWMQWGGYPFRERKVTAVTQHSAATGAY